MVVDVVCNEKGVAKDIIFEAIEAALASATKKRNREDIEARVGNMVDKLPDSFDILADPDERRSLPDVARPLATRDPLPGGARARGRARGARVPFLRVPRAGSVCRVSARQLRHGPGPADPRRAQRPASRHPAPVGQLPPAHLRPRSAVGWPKGAWAMAALSMAPFERTWPPPGLYYPQARSIPLRERI